MTIPDPRARAADRPAPATAAGFVQFCDRALSSKAGRLWSVAIVLAATLAVYGSTLNDFFLSDDFDLLMRASREPLGWWVVWPDPARSGWFRPVAEVLWRLNYLAGGLDPFVYRTTNLLLHLLNACLVLAIARRATGSSTGALAAGLLFATWPRATAAVTWLSGRYDLAATMFVLLAVVLAMRAARTGGRRARLMMIVCAVLALTSKEVAVVLPALLAVLALGRLPRTASGPPLVRWTDTAIVAVIVAIYISLRMAIFGGLGGYGIHGQISLVTLLRPLTLLPPFLPVDRVVAEPGSPAWMLVSAVLVAMLAIAAPRWLLWTLLGLLPAANLIDLRVPMFEFDRFFYLASAGWAIALSTLMVRIAGVAFVPGARTTPRMVDAAAMMLAVILVAVLGSSMRATLYRNGRWERAATLTRNVDTSLREARAQLRPGDAIDCSALPDNIGGAYAYRNGCDAQIRLTLGGDQVRGLRVVPGVPPDPVTAARDTFARVWVLSADGQSLTLTPGH